MARTLIRGNEQIMDATIDLGRMQAEFLAGQTWNVSTTNDATITGLAIPTTGSDAANKTYVDGIVDSTMKSPDGFDTTVGADYPSDYKGTTSVAEGDTFYITSIANGTLVGTKIVNVGDMLIALVDAPGNTDGNWAIMETNRDQATESVLGMAKIATTAIANAGTNDTDFITAAKLAGYISNHELDKVAGNGLTETSGIFNVVAADPSITVGANDIAVRLGDDNSSGSTSLVTTTTGVELASTIAGNRTFAPGATGTFTITTDEDLATLTTDPSGTVDAAITNVGWVKTYVDSASSNTTLIAGNGIDVSAAGDDWTVTAEANTAAGIVVDASGIGVDIGTTNGTSLEFSATGVELATTVTGSREFDVGAGTFEITAPVDAATLSIAPSGSSSLAIATVGYVLANSSNTTVVAGNGIDVSQSGDDWTVTAEANTAAGIEVTASGIGVDVGNSNGTSLEFTATGLELASTVTGARTFSGGAFSVDSGAAATTLAANSLITLDTVANGARLTAAPTGTVDLAIASTKWVQDEIAAAVPTSDTLVFNETPAVTHNNAVVTIANSPITGTQRVYLNGVRQVPGAGNDYTITGTTITFTDTLKNNDIVLVDYSY